MSSMREGLAQRLADGIPAYVTGLEDRIQWLEARHDRDMEYFAELNRKLGECEERERRAMEEV